MKGFSIQALPPSLSLGTGRAGGSGAEWECKAATSLDHNGGIMLCCAGMSAGASQHSPARGSTLYLAAVIIQAGAEVLPICRLWSGSAFGCSLLYFHVV